MNWGQFCRSRFDVLLLVGILAWLIHTGANESHEVLGAVLLALTGGHNLIGGGGQPPNATAPTGLKEPKS